MNISHKYDNNICIVEPAGSIWLSESDKFLEYVESLLASSEVQGMVIDMKRVDAIDSSGIGVILTIQKLLAGREKKCVLCHLSERVHEVFFFTKLLDQITICGTVDEGVSGVT